MKALVYTDTLTVTSRNRPRQQGMRLSVLMRWGFVALTCMPITVWMRGGCRR